MQYALAFYACCAKNCLIQVKQSRVKQLVVDKICLSNISVELTITDVCLLVLSVGRPPALLTTLSLRSQLRLWLWLRIGGSEVKRRERERSGDASIN